MKKVNSLILLFFMIFANLYGCGSKDMPEEEISEPMIQETSIEKNQTDYRKLSAKSYGFGYDKNFKKGEVPSIGFYAELLDGKNACYTGNTEKKDIFLTFDAGYENGCTESILNTLKEKKVPAAFFCTGDYLKCNEALIERMLNDGHIIGNHTWNHPKMPGLESVDEIKKELTEFDDYLYEHHNVKTRYFRYPEGEFSEKTLSVISDMGYTTVFWSLAYKDWERNVCRGTDYALSQVTNQIHNGAIILLHAVSDDNANALPLIIDKLREEGYTFRSLDEL